MDEKYKAGVIAGLGEALVILEEAQYDVCEIRHKIKKRIKHRWDEAGDETKE
jgi:hypothetical protein